MNEDDPIIAEIRQIREAMLAEHNGDLAALVKCAQRRTEEAIRAGRKVFAPPPPPEAEQTGNQPRRKVG